MLCYHVGRPRLDNAGIAWRTSAFAQIKVSEHDMAALVEENVYISRADPF